MSATVFDILGTVSDLGWNSEKDFALDLGQTLSSQTLVDQPDWSLYSLDLERNLAWFVELPPGSDLSSSAFAFRDQRRLARRVLQVSLDDLIEVSTQIPPPAKVIFVFSIGRCGSTLVSHVLNTSPRVWGLSEPIAFPRLIMTNYNSDKRLSAPRARMVPWATACCPATATPSSPNRSSRQRRPSGLVRVRGRLSMRTITLRLLPGRTGRSSQGPQQVSPSW